MSESSHNSGSSGGSQSNYVRDGPDDILETTNSMQTGIFGVLYTVSKEKVPSVPFITFRLFLEWLQLFLIAVNPQYGFTGIIDNKNTAWYVISFVQLNQFMSARGYTFFLVCLYIMVIGLMINVALCLYVAHSFQNNRFEAVWPIVLLRWYSLVFFQILEVASITFFLMTLDCQYFSVPAAVKGYNQEFGAVYCWSMPHIVHAGVAAVALAIFIPMAMLFTMAEIDTNPTTRNPLAVSHSQVEVLCIAIKAMMTCATVFITGLKWLSILQLCLSSWLVALYIYWLPHTYSCLNMVRSASFMSVWYTTVMLVFMAFMPGIDSSDAAAVSAFESHVTIAMWAGIVPAALLGAGLCWLRLRYFNVVVMRRFLTAPPGTKSKLIHEFGDPREVEVMVRCCRKWQPGWGGVEDEDALDPGAVKRAETIMKAGMTQLPKHPYMIILYSSFLIDVLGSYQTGFNQLQDAKKTDPNFMERFSVFSREQEHTQKESSAQNGESAVDLVTYVEFQRNYRLVIKVHKEALTTMRVFWKILLQSKVKFNTLALGIKKMDAAVRQAERVYRTVLARHMTSATILRLYSRFLFDVKNDPWASSKWLAASEKLEQEEDAQRYSEFSNFNVSPLGNNLQTLAEPNKLRIRESRSVVIINGACIVQMTEGMGELFGYVKPKELHGKNVSEIIPPPYADAHNGYVRTHVNTGRQVLLDRTNEMIALRKDRCAVPVNVTVSHLSGVGEDSMFMGILEPRPVDALSANAWVLPSGIVAGVGPSFVDWSGFKATELMGARLSTVLVDAGVIESVMEDVRRLRTTVVAKEAKKPASLVQRKKRRASISDYFARGSSLNILGAAEASEDVPPVPARVLGVGDASVARGAAAEPAPMTNDRRGRVTVELADERMVEVEYQVVGRDVIIPGLMMRHKYAEPIKVDVTVHRTALGQYQTYNLTLRRREPERMLLVSDRQGRIRYATLSLCELLESPLEALQAENSASAIDAILPEPFAQLHYLHRMELAAPRAAPPAAAPPHSCFSGVAVCLRSVPRSSVDPPRTLPVKLQISHRELTSSDLVYSLQVQPISLRQALDERRLRMMLDIDGNVVGIGGSSPSLFGFDPRLLRGKDVTTFLDVFKQAAKPDLSPRPGTLTPSVQSMLVSLVERSISSPGMSWRVGLVDPTPSKSISNLGAMGKAQMLQKTRPAVMTIRVCTEAPAEDEEASDPTWGTLLESHAYSAARPELASASGAALDSSADALKQSDVEQLVAMHMARLQAPAAAAPLRRSSGWSFSSFKAPAAAAAADSLLFEVELWNAALMCSVLELDATGALVGGGQVNPLCPPGLVLGAGQGCMSGHISALIPQLKDTSVHDLFLGKVGQVQGTVPPFRAANAGLLKRRNNAGQRAVDASRSAGQLVTMSVPHASDQRPVEVTVRAVWKIGSQSLAYVVLHAVNPGCGREDFAEWLLTSRPSHHRSPSRNVSMRSLECGSGRRGSSGLAPTRSAPGAPPGARRSLGTPTPTPALDSASNASGKLQAWQNPAAPKNPTDSVDALDWALEQVAKLNSEKGPVYHISATSAAAMSRTVSFPQPGNAGEGLKAPGAGSPAGPPSSSEPATPPQRAGLSHVDSRGAEDSGADSNLNDWLDDFPPEKVEEQYDSETESEAEPDAVLGTLSQADPEEDAHEVFTDYKRGKRFKKLYKFLGNAQVTATMSRFRLKMVLTALVLLLAHVVFFAVMLSLLEGVQDSITDLYSSALASRKVYEIAIDCEAIAVILANKTDPSQPGLDGPDSLPSFVDDLDFVSGMFRSMHQGVYMGFRAFKRLPTAYGLRDIWDKPVINVTTFYDVYDEPPMVQSSTMMGLWDVGNMYLEKARRLWVYASTAINSTDPNNVIVNISMADFTTDSDFYFIMANGPGVITYNYGLSLDWLMQQTVKASNAVNTVHLIIMVVEGMVLVAAAAVLAWRLTQHVSRMRYDMYSCFVQIPHGMIRSLAEKTISLDGEADDEEQDGELVLLDHTAGPKDALVPKQGVSVSIREVRVQGRKRSLDGTAPEGGTSMKGGAYEAGGSGGGLWSRLTSLFSASPRQRQRLQQQQQEKAALKRKLQASNRTAILMVVPFFLWSTVVVVMNTINYTMLTPMSSAISLLNIICSVLIRHHVNFFFAMSFLADNSGLKSVSYAFSPDLPLAAQASMRARFAYELDLFELEYQAMLFGGDTVANPAPHFAMSSTGIATTANAAKSILYSGNECLCEDPTNCQVPGSFYYSQTMSGLDALLKDYFVHFRSLVLSDASVAKIGAPAYSYILSLGQNDIEGGIVKMTQVYFNQLQSQYKSTETLQIIQLVVVSVISVAFVVFMVLPLIKEVWTETRRIAELLAQLPQEIDVESIVCRTLQDSQMSVKSEKRKPEHSMKSTLSTNRLLPDLPGVGGGGSDHGSDADLKWAEAGPPTRLSRSGSHKEV